MGIYKLRLLIIDVKLMFAQPEASDLLIVARMKLPGGSRGLALFFTLQTADDDGRSQILYGDQ